MKKIIVLATIFVALIIFFVFGLISDKVTDAKCFKFDSNSGLVTGYDDKCGSTVVIPSKIDNVKVIKIDNYAFRDKDLTKVVLPSTMKEIGIGAFYNNKITTLKLNNGLEVINALSFSQNKIGKLVIPSSVKLIGNEAFNGNELSDRHAFIYQRNDKGEEDKTIIIGYGGKNKDVKIPDGVTSLYLAAFSNSHIKTVTIPSGVERLEYNALASNDIKEITIPKSVKYIGEGVLLGNPISKITIQGKKALEEFDYLGQNWNNGCQTITFK